MHCFCFPITPVSNTTCLQGFALVINLEKKKRASCSSLPGSVFASDLLDLTSANDVRGSHHGALLRDLRVGFLVSPDQKISRVKPSSQDELEQVVSIRLSWIIWVRVVEQVLDAENDLFSKDRLE
jgi:hypothetical protein